MLKILKPFHFGRNDIIRSGSRIVNEIFQNVRGEPLLLKRDIEGVGHIASRIQTKSAPVLFAHSNDVRRISAGKRVIDVENAPTASPFLVRLIIRPQSAEVENEYREQY